MEEFDIFMKRLIRGAKNMFFRTVIKSSSGYDIIKLEGDYLKAAKIIKNTIEKSFLSINMSVKKNCRGRTNELSNYLEGVLKNVINHKIKGFEATIPKAGNKKRSAGYPDLLIKFDHDKFIYVEVKIYQKKTLNSSLRTFYFKPSEQDKIMRSCPHILIGFEVESLGEDNRSPFNVNSFKIIDLYDLKVTLKPEFNASNPMIYKYCKEV